MDVEALKTPCRSVGRLETAGVLINHPPHCHGPEAVQMTSLIHPHLSENRQPRKQFARLRLKEDDKTAELRFLKRLPTDPTPPYE